MAIGSRRLDSVSPAGLTWPWSGLWRSERLVEVVVVVRGHEVDRFTVHDTSILAAALRPIYAHLPAGAGEVRLTGIVDPAWPRRRTSRREVALASFAAAGMFLEAPESDSSSLRQA